MEFVTTPSPTSKARWYAIHSGSHGAQGGILCLISQRLSAAPSVQFTNVLQGRLLHVRIPFQTPLDLLYQYAWNTQKKFEDTQGRKIDALLKQRKVVWNHITQWMRRTPQRNGCILLGDFNTPLFSCGLHVGHGVISLSKAIQTDQEIFQEIVQSTGCCALNTWSKAGKAARTFLPAQGHSESGTQIDFLIARGRLADGKAKACSTFEAPFVPSSGCRHLPLQCTFVRPRPPMTPGQSTRTSARQAQELMKHDAVRCHYKEQVLARVESAAEHEDLDTILRECWRESCDRFRKTNLNAERDPTHSLPSQRDNENLVQQLWSTRAMVRQQQVLKHADLHALFEGWKLASTLQRISRQLRKASKRRKLELVERVVGSTNVFKAAKILHPKTPKRRLQLRDSEGRIQTREAEFEQLTSFFRQLYDGPPSSTWTISCNPNFTEDEVRNALLKFSPSKALPSTSAPAVLWKATSDTNVTRLCAQLVAMFRPGIVKFPASWTVAEMALLPKPGKALKTAADIRPIALLHPCAKIVASIVAERLRPMALQYLSDIPQFAYVAGRSLQHALERVVAHCVRVRKQLVDQSINIHAKRNQESLYR